MIKEMFNNKKKYNDTEIGFGNKNYHSAVRFLNRDGSVNVKRKVGTRIGFDLYHWLITTTWQRFICVVFGGYVFINLLFTILYYIVGADKFGGLKIGCRLDDFLQLFFFSAQTLTTVGYGHIYPNHTIVSSIAAIESMFGLLGFALATGILYGRFSRPKADIEYSNNAVIAPYDGVTALMLRMANKRQYELIECESKIVLAMNNIETSKREFHNLKLELSTIAFFPFSWTVVHSIDENSPLYKLTEEQFKTSDAEVIISFKAINDTYSQTVYSRISYKPGEVVWNAKFVPIKQEPNEDGSINFDLKNIHHITKI